MSRAGKALVGAKGNKERLLYIDLLRGLAIAMMVVFHFTFDLDHFGFVEVNMLSDPFWLDFRLVIVSLFLGLVGFSLQLSAGKRIRLRPYFKRLGLLVGSAALISLGTWIMYGDKMILFGVLHFIALASVLGLLFRRLYWSNLLLGVGILFFSNWFSHPWFNAPAWHWIGLTTQLPSTLDYVPLFPWFGVVLIGMFLGRLSEEYGWLRKKGEGRNPLTRLMALSGRHSLLIYMVHQPILFGAFYLVTLLV